MAELHYIKPAPRRPGARIYLHVADIVDMVQQEDVVQAMKDEELTEIAETINAEQQRRRTNEPQ